MNRETGSSARAMQRLSILLIAGLLTGCAAYGGVATARISEDRVVASSNSATVSTSGISTRSERTEIRY